MNTTTTTKKETTGIGSFIQKKREALGLSQLAVAKTLGWETAQFVSNIERGTALLPANRIIKLAKIIKVSSDDLIRLNLAAYKEKYVRKVMGK